MSGTPPKHEPSTNSAPEKKVEQAAQAAQARPEMTIEELLNFSFRDATTTSRVGSIIRRTCLSCS